MDEHRTCVNDCLTCGNSCGEPSVSFKLHSYNAKCGQKLVNLENLFLSTNSDPTVIDMFCALHVPACILFSSYPCLFAFLRCLFWLPSVVSCKSPYIEYWWTWYICLYNDCLKFGNSWGGGTLLWTSNCLFLNVKCSQKLVNLGNLCLSTILVQKLLTYVFFFCTCPFAFSSLPTFAFPFFLDVYLGCHQKAAAGTHT